MRKETVMLLVLLLVTMASFPVVSADSVAIATSDARSWNGGLADVGAYAYASDVQTVAHTNVYTIGNAKGRAYAYARNDGYWCCIEPISDSQPQR